MAVVTNPTALTEAATNGTPSGPSLTEQNLDIANGNKFAIEPGKRLYVRNTTAGAIGIDLFADIGGQEVKIVDGSIAANKVGANGVRIMGPFDPRLLADHSASIPAGTAQMQVVCKQTSGIAGDLKACPYVSLNL